MGVKAWLNARRARLKHLSRLFGARGWLVPFRTRGWLPTEFRVTPDNAVHPIALRAGTSDVTAYEQVFASRQYEVRLAAPPRTIVDCGGHIGLTAVYFACAHPRARVIVVEPDPENFELLRRNVAPYPTVTPVHGAVWSKAAMMSVVDPGIGTWGYQTVPADQTAHAGRGEVRARTIPELMEEHGLDSIDILKLDIEGAEKQVLETSIEWIDRVGTLMVEVHPDLNAGASDVFDRVAEGFDRRWRQGDVDVVARASS